MISKLRINGDILLSYIEGSSLSLDDMKEKIKDVDQFISGEKMPTFNQLVKIASLIHVPAGLLTLQKQMNLNVQRLAFRTIDSGRVQKISPELRDTITEMQDKQAFLHDQVDDSLGFIGSLKIDNDHMAASESVRSLLHLPLFHQSESGNNPLRYFRDKINICGVFIFFNGKVLDNTHRPPNLDEFRGFALNDSKAPIIFINQRDHTNAQLFTLIHELVHIFIGDEGISQASDIRDFSHNRTEAYINKITAEVLVPAALISVEENLDIQYLASKYKVSRYVIVRRLFDLNKITHQQYNDYVRAFQSGPEREPRINNGGNYHNNLKFRMDTRFFQHVNNAVLKDMITYSEAFSLVGVKYKGYKILVDAVNHR